MLIDCVSKIGKHLHLYVFEFGDLVTHTMQSTLRIHSFLVFLFFEIHFLELLIEELSLLQTFFLLADNFSLLKVSCQLFLLFGIHFFDSEFFHVSFFLALGLKGYHFFVRPLQPLSLFRLALVLCLVQT